MKLISGIKKFFTLTVPAFIVILIVLEVIFRTLIPACELPDTFWNDEYKLIQFDTLNREGIYTIGKMAQQRGKWRINNHNWNSPIDYSIKKDRPLIAVIGDSYVQAMQVDVDESFHSLLSDKLLGYDIYSFGKSGAPLTHYLHISRYVNDLFDPDILIVSVVYNDFYESVFNLFKANNMFFKLNFQNENIIEIEPTPPHLNRKGKSVKYLMKKSALFSYVYNNLNIKRMMSRNKIREKKRLFENNIDPVETANQTFLIKRMTEYVLGKFKEENPDKRIIFLMDGPRNHIYSGTVDKSLTLFLNEIMMNACEKYEIELLDLTHYFIKDYELIGRKFNSNWDNHWDEYGHKFVSDVLYNYLIEKPDEFD